MRASEELLGDYQHVIDDLKLIPSKGGVFEVIANDHVVYSKKTIGRHAEEGEVLKNFIDLIGPDVPKYND